MKLKTFRGVDIYVSEDGEFSAHVAGDPISATTLKEVEAKVQKTRKRTKVKVAVPFSILGWQLVEPKYGPVYWSHGDGVRHMTATGVHQNGNIIARDDLTGAAEQLGRYTSSKTFVRRLTDDEVAEWVRLHKAADKAREELDNFESDVKLPKDLDDIIKEAQAEAADDPKESPHEAEVFDPR